MGEAREVRRRGTSLALPVVAAATAALLALSGCSTGDDTPAGRQGAGSQDPAASDPQLATAVMPAQASTLVPGTTADELAAGLSSVLFAGASRVLVAGADDAAAQQTAADAAGRLRVPVLVSGDAAATEVARLGAEVVPVGDQAQQWVGERGLAVAADVDLAAGAPATSGSTGAQQPPTSVVLVTGAAGTLAATATARAAGADVVALPDADPRADGDLVALLGETPQIPVVALGDAFGPAERLDERLASVRTGVQVPGPDGLGGQLPLAGRRLVALYGHPGTPSLGILGEQDTAATLQRAKDLAQTYAGLDDRPPAPALEIIATTASSSPGSDGDYSAETPVEELRPLVEAALADGVQVVLDLQPGRETFLDQAEQYAELLALPGVGLALDPEWRLAPGQVHLAQVGSVDVEEVNRTSAWLADLVRERALPQKVFLVHQFRTSMVTDRENLDTGRDELVYVLHVDGAGRPADKEETYATLTEDPPDGVQWGWKNFLDEDSPVLSPAQTVAQDPVPVFVSYQ